MDGWTAEANELRLRIEQWPESFYLFVFRKSDTVSFRDELQDTLAIAMAAAREDFGVVPEAWRRERWGGAALTGAFE